MGNGKKKQHLRKRKPFSQPKEKGLLKKKKTLSLFFVVFCQGKILAS